MGRGALIFCNLHFKSTKPRVHGYPAQLLVLGDHIRARRLDKGLLQKDVAKLIGVCEDTITGWENGRTKPALKHLPRIHEFLGYMPNESDSMKLIGEQLLQYRKSQGMTRKELASRMGLDERTVRRLEQGETHFFKKTIAKVELFWNGIRSDI